MRHSNQSGQIVVILLLIMLVGVTIGLSITTRTLQQMKVATVSEQSSRAYTAAEAAIEEALRQELAGGMTGSVSLGPSISEARYEVEETPEFSLTVQKDEVAQANLEDFTGSAIDVYWVSESDPNENTSEPPGRASLELTFIKNDGGDYSVIRFAVNADARSASNGFTDPGGSDISGGVNLSRSDIVNCGLPSSGYCNKAAITGLSDIEILRVKPFYNRATILVESSPPGLLSSQLFTISGEATTRSDVTRKVEVTKAPPALPPIFDYVIFDGSGNALRK